MSGTNTSFSSPFGEASRIPMPVASPFGSSLEEKYSIESPRNQLLSLDIILEEFEKYLEKQKTF